jgi:hypothetical protein
MFKISGSAYEKLVKTVEMEREHEGEQLFIRAAMGIG